MSNEWTQAKLGEVVDFLAGFAFKSEHYTEQPVGPRLCLGANVAPGAPDWSKLRYWPRSMCAGVDRYLLAEGDVVLAMDRPWIPDGLKVFRFYRAHAPALLVQRVARMRGTQLVDAGYLYALLRHPGFTEYILGVQTGTTVPHISAAQILNYGVRLPPLDEQRRIAAILGALDDKIELNRRMSQTLDEMAQTMFKSWFIDFDGHDDLVEGEFGWVPRVWAVGTLADLADLNPESWSTKTRPPSIRYVDLSNTKWGAIEAVTNYLASDAPSRAQRVLRAGDSIVGTVRPGNGSYAFVGSDGFTGSTGFAVLRPKRPASASFVYLAATRRENIERLAHLADGGAYPAVRPELVAATPSVLPSSTDMVRFAEVADPLLRRIAANRAESRTLTTVRDTLLPKLISGELRVPDAEAAVSEAM